MDKVLSFRLLDIVKDHLPIVGEKRARGATPNGPITKMTRLSMTLRYCAGGNPLDISDIHGVNTNEVPDSLQDVVDAVHALPELDITFPESLTEQMEVMQGFKAKSTIGINCCVGAIDGIISWTH